MIIPLPRCSKCGDNSHHVKGLCKKCYDKQYNKQYYLDNIERLKQRMKQYYSDNRERVKQRHRQYYNKPEVRVYRKIYELIYRPRRNQLHRERIALRRGWGKID